MKLKISFVLLFFFFSVTLFSQEKDFEKIKSLFENGEYEKCIEKAEKVKTKYTKEPLPFYYIAFSNFEMYKNSAPLKKKMYLNNTINNLNFGLKQDAEKSEFKMHPEAMGIIHDSIILYADNLWFSDKKGEAEYYYENLAKIYQDTTVQYIEIFMTQIIKIEQDLAFKEYSGPVNETDIAGNRQGLWVKKYPSGVVESEIFFKDNKPAGIFRKYYENGNLKANMFFDENSPKVAAILYNEEGQKISMGFYYNQKKDSLWQYFINDSIVISEENYVKGVKNGYERTYNLYMYPNLAEEKFWKNGKQDSTWTRYYTNGKPHFIAIYRDGIRHGEYVAFDENGQTIVQGQYKNNLMHGKWKMWDAEQMKIIEIEYIDGHPVNEDELSEKETDIINQMLEMQGKFQEPNVDYQGNGDGGDF